MSNAMTLGNVFSLPLLRFIYAFSFCIVLYAVYTSSLWIYCLCMVVMYVCFKAIRQKSIGEIDINGQGIIITGCDSGIGHDLAVKLDQLGFIVFAGCLHPDGEGAQRLKSTTSSDLHIVPLDVGSSDSVKEAHDYVVKHLPKSGLWAIVNNAGFNVMGDVEFLTVDLFHKVMNVNFYGAVRMFNTFLYLIRKSKGRVVVVTSVKGMYSWPNNSAYHATKYALGTMTDALRLEMLKFGVKVAKVLPGNFSMATACQSQAHFGRYREEADEMWKAASSDVRKTYGRHYLDNMIDRQERSIQGSAKTTRPVVDALVDAIMSDRPHTSYLVDGGDKWIDPPSTLARYYGFLPTWLSDKIICRLTNCDTFPDYSNSG